MARRWKCARCSHENDEGLITCANCGMIRGGVVVSSQQGSSPTWPTRQDVSQEVPGDESQDVAASLAPEPAPAPWVPGSDDVAAVPAPRPFWRRIPAGVVIWVVLITGGAIAGFIFNASRAPTGEITRGGNLEASELRVGDCFDLKDPSADEVGDVKALPCTDEHEYETFFTGSMQSASFPGSEGFRTFVEDNCLPAFETYVGMAYEASELDIFWLEPLSDGWAAGDHSVQCAVYHPEVNRLKESLKGSQR